MLPNARSGRNQLASRRRKTILAGAIRGYSWDRLRDSSGTLSIRVYPVLGSGVGDSRNPGVLNCHSGVLGQTPDTLAKDDPKRIAGSRDDGGWRGNRSVNSV